MSVTVLLVVKNSPVIKQCVESLLNQTYKNYDILVVDGYSTDGTFEILKSFGNKIKLFQVPGWAPKAFNWARKRIKSDFVALTDGDCIVDKHWLEELIKGFKLPDIIAVAGYYGTWKGRGLQRVIGIEMEDRFRNPPKYISKAPSANFCIRTEIFKKVKFDEKLRVAYEADFDYKILKFGKIFYNSKAVVYHYHRANWKSYFNQQRLQSTYFFTVMMRYKASIKGDYITQRNLIAQIGMFCLGILMLFLSPLISLFLFSCILGIFLFRIRELRLNRKDAFTMLGMFTVRLIACSIGLINGILLYLIKLRTNKK